MFCGLCLLLCCLKCCWDYCLLWADASKFARRAPRNCTLLRRHNTTQWRLRSRVKKLCKARWHAKTCQMNVYNVGVVTNASLRQRYEQAYQTAQTAAQPSNSAAQSTYIYILQQCLQRHRHILQQHSLQRHRHILQHSLPLHRHIRKL